MRTRLLAAVLIAGLSLTLSLIRGQERPPGQTDNPAYPVIESPSQATTSKPARAQAALPKLQQQMLLTAQRGADWLFRMHGVKGRFRHGYLPALAQAMEGDSYLHQAGAAFALARTARFTGEDRYAARATQAVLALLDETALDPGDSMTRSPSLPAGAVNRLGAAAALVLAIHELPAPQKDLLDPSDQLCRYIKKQARADGSLMTQERTSSKDADEDVNLYPGLALHALMQSYKHRPAEWKLDLVGKALPYYRVWWKEHPSMEFVPEMTAAFTSAYLLTKEIAFADFVFEMNDWLCSLQHVQIDPRRMYWYGGFMSHRDGRSVQSAPDVRTGFYAHGLIEACRVAREQGDLTRFQRYSEAVERSLQFLATLQYTDAVAQHYAAWFRPQIVGGFHVSHSDGNLRIDYTQHAVSALLGYLEHVAR
jgi:hypothetical protein